ncbi:HNH endonuclease [Rhizocola hellebori]|uniref:HNH endonuclease n=2 Tax=Rhizocola hellebori TaxID=1392758 RepID=A0A8J3Q1H3_9ACTN|nr:HNH endonuclease [Rhizocola hellebori]
MSDNELSGELLQVWAAEQAIVARRLGLVREIDGRGLAGREGATSAAVWLRDRLRVTIHSARQMLSLAAVLDGPCEATGAALADGVVNVQQARVIADAVNDLGEHGPAVQAKAEQVLLHPDCVVLEPVSLKVAADHVLEHVAPELAEEKQRRDLEAAERRAARDRAFTMSPDGTGRVRLSGWLGHEAAAIINAAIDPLCAPAGKHDDRTATQRRADALTEACRLTLAAGELPENGGDRPQLVLTMRHDDLLARIGHGMLDTGQPLTPDTVRRIACQANIIPAVLNTTGQVLDLGRQRRLFTGPIRRALILRDGGCAFPGCDRPPRWCDGHHILSWLLGGATRLDNAVLLCGHHHRLIHHSEWEVRIGPDGLPEFLPPSYMDPLRRPLRHHRHRRP